MGATSAGLLLYRIPPGGAVEVLIAHPGGPFWARKDDAAWSVPKGEYMRRTKIRSTPPTGSSKRRWGFLLPAGAGRLPRGAAPTGRQAGQRLGAGGGPRHHALVEQHLRARMAPRVGQRSGNSPRSTGSSGCSVDQAGRKLVKGQAPFLGALLETIGRRAGRAGPASTTPAR